jgi:hypothetical protein
VHSGVYLLGVKASARVFFGNSRIDSDFNCAGGSFVRNKELGGEPWEADKHALFLGAAKVQGPIWLTDGFKADGAVDINQVVPERFLFRRAFHKSREGRAFRLGCEC